MTTLTIKDLARSEQLDRTALSAVRGGTKMSLPGCSFGPGSYGQASFCGPGSSGGGAYAPSSDSSVHATQDLAQFQNVTNATANGAAFVGGVCVNNNTSLFGQNNVVAG
ncbi:MAG: hypothetical protein JWR40_2340 [Massilia sp.]|jgi:hypothetical protein|nr:hypothetical protein [Massilia sp.]MDB5950002.1 hypothetical protein [Massilia sp.]